MSHSIKLLSKREIAEGTMTFEFEKPEGYNFTAGQATDWTMIDPAETDAEGNSRSFSLACAPGETVLRLATRMRDTAFKRCMKAMPIGGEISIDDPWGEFVLDGGEAIPAVFLCGGIGITPFYSMMVDATLKHTSRDLYLFYSNKTPKDAPFRAEINEMAVKNSAIKLIETLTEGDASWSGERGFIDRAMLERHLSNLSRPTYYIAGPPQMVAAMNKMLLGAGVNESRIKLDEFSGY
jgi:ferredoxin-NADP reductase